MIHKRIIYMYINTYICIYKHNLALHNPRLLICYETTTSQTNKPQTIRNDLLIIYIL